MTASERLEDGSGRPLGLLPRLHRTRRLQFGVPPEEQGDLALQRPGLLALSTPTGQPGHGLLGHFAIGVEISTRQVGNAIGQR